MNSYNELYYIDSQLARLVWYLVLKPRLEDDLDTPVCFDNIAFEYNPMA